MNTSYISHLRGCFKRAILIEFRPQRELKVYVIIHLMDSALAGITDNKSFGTVSL